jgi:hypothetical protein
MENGPIAFCLGSKDVLFNFTLVAFFIINLRPDESQPLNLNQAKANTCTCNYSSSLSNGSATFLAAQLGLGEGE